jgi:hypothetical protein
MLCLPTSELTPYTSLHASPPAGRSANHVADQALSVCAFHASLLNPRPTVASIDRLHLLRATAVHDSIVEVI